ncbi:MAG: DUF4912 domain-containing protein [Spirochaetia bacterium]
MNRKRLAELPLQSLIKIGRKIGIENPEDSDRDNLIENIWEVLEENRSERMSSDANPIRFEELKYDIPQTEQFFDEIEDEFVLPESYNETKIVLLLRDPSWAFAYWDIKKETQEELLESSDFTGIYLRLLQCMENGHFFDIPVKMTDNRWYINLPTPGITYYLELLVKRKEREEVLAHSNSLKVPQGNSLNKIPEGSDEPADQLLLMSGIVKMNTVAFSSSIPHRVLASMEDRINHAPGNEV